MKSRPAHRENREEKESGARSTLALGMGMQLGGQATNKRNKRPDAVGSGTRAEGNL